MKKGIFLLGFILFSTIALPISADTVGQKNVFFIDSGYDLTQRNKLTAILVKRVSNLYFYVDENWWNFISQDKIYQSLDSLGEEFENNIYPKLISAYGSEWNPGIDGDPAITVLIHPMKKNAGGYFRSNDEYSKVLISDSNEREMLYINSDYIDSKLAKSFLAHEFTHLITFNQKENKNNVTEEVWLNELRAEYAPTLAGYDNVFAGSNLERRIQDFSDNPSESLTEWRGDKSNYGSINLFAQYLADHYGAIVLRDSLQISKIGVESLDYALEKNGFKGETFPEIFKNWVIAVLINNCDYGQKYCYLNFNLRNFHITPQINFLPFSGESTLTFSDTARRWSGNWYKIIGGNGVLDFKFNNPSKVEFIVPYIAQNKSGGYGINFLKLDKNGQGGVVISGFGTEIVSLFIIPSILTVSENKPFYSFSWSVSVKKDQNDAELINSLLARIADLQRQIALIQAQIAATQNGGNLVCAFAVNLSYGMQGREVKCLQNFLKSQGFNTETTSYFGSLTKAAVIRFQEKYSLEILAPVGLKNGTGFVGVSTRAKIKRLLTI